MTIKSIQELITLCRAGSCAIELHVCQSGAGVTVRSHRKGVFMQTSEYLDANDAEAVEKLEAAVKRVQ